MYWGKHNGGIALGAEEPQMRHLTMGMGVGKEKTHTGEFVLVSLSVVQLGECVYWRDGER